MRIPLGTRWLAAPAVGAPPVALGATLAALATALATALAPGQVFAQGFEAVFSRDGVDVWAVGDGGLYWRSFDSGASWTARPNLGARTLRGVAARGFTALAVGDSGRVWRSTDSGGAWTLRTLPGAPDLTGIEFPADNAAYVVGDNGAIYFSADGGQSWSPQTSGTTQKLNAVRFRDALNGWAVGRGGVALRTANGGALWTPANVPQAAELLSVDFLGSTVWAVGAFGAAYKSGNAGGSWTPVNLQMDSQSDVRRVWMATSSQVLLTGGGGFLRSTPDGGTSWTFITHPLLGPTTGFFVYGPNLAWLCSSASTAVARSTNGGTTWSFPAGTTTTYTWAQKQIAPFAIIRGMTFATIPQNRNSVWCVMGPYVYKSLDRGESWTPIDTIPGVSKVNSFYVSPKDSTHWVAAVGTPDGIARTLDAGASWNVTLARDFGEYGSPLEMHPDKPDTLLFGPEDGYLYRSRDFGATWDTLSNPGFRSPCDIVIVPGDDSKVLVADGVTGSGFGQVFQSVDGGLNFTLRFTGASSENPMMWVSRLANNVAYVTNWSSGGVWRSLDYGQTWNQVSSVSSAWGGAVSGDDPKATVFNRYAGTPNYLSLDQGQTFTATNLSNVGSGYSLDGLDRSTWLDLHSAGIYKLVTTHIPPQASGKSITVTAPNGGEAWAVGSSHALTWSAPNLALVHIEYRTSPTSAWQPIADVAGYAGTYAWTVPNTPSANAIVRVSDAWGTGVTDTTDAPFTIVGPLLAVTPVALAYGSHPLASATLDTLRISNPGTGPLHVTAVSSSDPAFVPGRTALTLAPGASDTLGVTFTPTLAQDYGATLSLVNDAGPTALVPLSGTGTNLTQIVLVAPTGGSAWQFGRSYNILWQSQNVANVAVEYRTSEAAAWQTIADPVPGPAGQQAWVIPNAPTSQARVRVRDSGGTPEAVSDLFSLVVPAFAVLPSPYDFGPVPLQFAMWDTLHIENAGTAPLTVSNVTSDNARFFPGRTSLVVEAGSFDSLSVHFQPLVVGPDSALFTFTTDDPAGTHTLRVRGTGMISTAVAGLPARFALEPGFPNPFGTSIVLRFALPVRTDVQLDVYTTDGRRVRTLVRGPRDAGTYAVPFEPGPGLPSGVYFVRFTAGAFQSTRKIVHLSP